MNSASKTVYETIRMVGIYLRKSRGESDADLEKHRMRLIEMCKKYKWRWLEFAEIGNSEYIATRPEMKRLLDAVVNKTFDAVLVVDIDRLGRGDLEDQGVIKRVFRESETLIVTPDSVFDLTNTNDDFMIDIKNIFARQEYLKIKERLQQGKKFGARLGNWVSGKPPYPYEYERYNNKYNEKGLVVNDEKLKVYRHIIDKAMEGYPPMEIAWELNRMKIPSPNNTNWSHTTIHRLLIDETHLGKIIMDKTKVKTTLDRKNDKKVLTKIKRPKQEWIIVENCHEPVKTQYEHDLISIMLKKRNITPVAARHGSFALSGLVKCMNCHHTLSFQRKVDGKVYIKPCKNHDPYGNRCQNRGGNADIVINTIIQELGKYEEEIKRKIDNEENIDNDLIKGAIDAKLKEIKEQESIIERIDSAYEKGIYDDEKYISRMNKAKETLSQLEEDLSILERQLESTETITNQDKLQTLQQFKDKIQNKNIPDKELNMAFKTIIDHVKWKRNGNDIEVSVNFL